MGWLSELFGGAERRALELKASSSFPRHVNGETHCQPHLWRLYGRLRPGKAHRILDALLIPEPDNPHDPSAVRVQIRGGTVGYLPREDAARYVAELAKLGRAGEAARVRAKVMPGDGRGGEVLLRVVLSFTWPLREAAGGQPPRKRI